MTDMQLAKNLGAKGVLIQNQTGMEAETTPGLVLQHSFGTEYNPEGQAIDIELVADSWEQIYQFLKLPPRRVKHRRTTRETDISIELDLDGTGKGEMHTGLGFFDHMLDQLARHGSFDLKIETRGDLHIDEHHSIEDTALALGEAFALALGDKRGIDRYGFTLPMDDVLAQVALDFGGRPWLVWDAAFHRERIGEMPTEMFMHFFKSFSDASRCNLNIRAEGGNEHHKIEAIFKAFAKALKMSIKRDPNNMELPTTKGIL
jgi:imidazoleglycerol-phosphate dehydratase/histidinol-phosphatase